MHHKLEGLEEEILKEDCREISRSGSKYKAYDHDDYLIVIDSMKRKCNWYIMYVGIVEIPLIGIKMPLPIKDDCRYAEFGKCSCYIEDRCTRHTKINK